MASQSNQCQHWFPPMFCQLHVHCCPEMYMCHFAAKVKTLDVCNPSVVNLLFPMISSLGVTNTPLSIFA